jgi:hypothetical protein
MSCLRYGADDTLILERGRRHEVVRLRVRLPGRVLERVVRRHRRRRGFVQREPGVGRWSEWGFEWLRDGDTAPMTDAQGSCFIDSTLRLTGTTAMTLVAQTTVTVDGYNPNYQPPAELQVAVGSDGARCATGLRASLDVPASNLAGRTVPFTPPQTGARRGPRATFVAP